MSAGVRILSRCLDVRGKHIRGIRAVERRGYPGSEDHPGVRVSEVRNDFKGDIDGVRWVLVGPSEYDRRVCVCEDGCSIRVFFKEGRYGPVGIVIGLGLSLIEDAS